MIDPVTIEHRAEEVRLAKWAAGLTHKIDKKKLSFHEPTDAEPTDDELAEIEMEMV